MTEMMMSDTKALTNPFFTGTNEVAFIRGNAVPLGVSMIYHFGCEFILPY